MRPVSLACLAFVLAAGFCAGACAQTLYKLIDKNGKVTYSEEKPKQFDGQVIEMNIDPNANRATLPKYTPAPAGSAGAAGGPITPAQMANVQRANEKLAAAKRALDEAKANPEMTRMGKVGGGSREVVSPEYEARIAKLQQDVKDAEDEVRNALNPPR
jgi:hypothetical protein